MLYPLTVFSTMFGLLKRCPHCGKLQAKKKDHRQSACSKCGHFMTVQLRKGKAV